MSALSEPNRLRLIAYIVRTAPVHAADPLDWLRRVKAGEAVKARVRQGPQKVACVVLHLTRKKA